MKFKKRNILIPAKVARPRAPVTNSQGMSLALPFACAGGVMKLLNMRCILLNGFGFSFEFIRLSLWRLVTAGKGWRRPLGDCPQTLERALFVDRSCKQGGLFCEALLRIDPMTGWGQWWPWVEKRKKEERVSFTPCKDEKRRNGEIRLQLKTVLSKWRLKHFN